MPVFNSKEEADEYNNRPDVKKRKARFKQLEKDYLKYFSKSTDREENNKA